MSDSSAFGFGKFVPGFDFLQSLSKTAAQATPGAGAGAVPGMSSWVAPTLSIEEIDKRIQELKSVLFWLEQNTTALKATIQAMEVQKMTLSTLQSMNVSMADLAKAFTVKPPAAEPVATARQAPPEPEPEPEAAPEETAAADKAASKPAVDPMQWWGALTQQFQDIAAAAVKDVAAEAMKAGMTAKSASKAASKSSATKKSPAAKKAPTKTRAATPSATRQAASQRKAP